MIGSMRICMILLFLGIKPGLSAQTPEELALLKEHTQHRQEKKSYAFLRENRNELQQISSTLFLAYKSFISSQDAVSCVFYPSCSEYAVQAIQEQGFLLGIMNAFDRLTRCNALSPEEYSLYPGTNLFYDPVEPHEHTHSHAR